MLTFSLTVFLPISRIRPAVCCTYRPECRSTGVATAHDSDLHSAGIATAHQSDQQSSCQTIFHCPNTSNVVLRPRTSPLSMHDYPLRVAYQGLPGAFSEAAVAKAYPGCEAIPCDLFETTFEAVELWIADRAVLPLENSLGGSIHRNYDLLLRHRLHIVGEVQLPIHHCLLALPGVELDQIKRVISHPQALAQCEHTLTKRIGLGPHATRESFSNTAGAAEHVSRHGLRDSAVIASAEAGALYDLNILAEGIQDEDSNTRFVIVARNALMPRTGRSFKTSIVFACGDEGVGGLFKVMSAFAFRGISLVKIESRPRRRTGILAVAGGAATKRFDYMFYIEFAASMAEARAQNALADIEGMTSFMRILGSYPVNTILMPS